MKKILVAGGRDFIDYDRLKSDLDTLKPTTIISGMARGADEQGYRYALNNNLECLKFLANWNRYGKSAGFIRNEQMLSEGKPDLVLVYWNGSSKGTAHMINIAKKASIRTIVKYYNIDQHNLELDHEVGNL